MTNPTELNEPALPTSAPRTAVIMCHGMGQQVPFQTLNDAVEMASSDPDNPDAKTDFIEHHGCRIPRATIHNSKGGQADFFEVYWAPLTEGRVTVWDTIRFLVQGSARGIAHGSAKFERSVFGKLHAFPMPDKAGLTLTGVLLALALIGISFLNFCALSTLAVFSGFDVPRLITAVIFAFLPTFVVVAAVVLFILKVPADAPVPNSTKEKPGKDGRAGAVESVIQILLCVMLVTDAIALLNLEPRIHAAIGSWIESPWWMVLAVALWCAIVVGYFKAREKLIQYFGDVAAYVSSHEVNKFFQLRDQIHEASKRVFDAVYQRSDQGRFVYDRIVITGHSLGSVIAYDGLNRLFADEKLQGLKLDAANRTKFLLTFGSPLDKTAFFFRTQTDGAPTREALAENLQSLIHDLKYRQFPWVNVYATRDIFAGSLDFYDVPGDQPLPTGCRVFNVIDAKARTPILSHTEYYKTGYIARFLKAAIEGDKELKDAIPEYEACCPAPPTPPPVPPMPADPMAMAIAPSSGVSPVPSPAPAPMKKPKKPTVKVTKKPVTRRAPAKSGKKV